MNKFILLSIFYFFVSCKSIKVNEPILYRPASIKYFAKIDNLKNWHFLDIEIDTIPGISLNRAYDSLLLKDRNPEQIIIAVIDNETDVNHKELVGRIWSNKKEIPSNNIDDDKNGYVDDVQGWNFIGNSEGDNNLYVNFETTRILKKLIPYFQKKDTINLSNEDSKLFQYFSMVKKTHANRLEYFTSKKNKSEKALEIYNKADDELSVYFKNRSYTISALDSLKQSNNNEISEFSFMVIKDCVKYNLDKEYFINEKKQASNMVDILLNLEYNDRLIQGDKPDDISNTKYGNNIMSNNVEFLDHGTKMSGIISGISQNNEINIMPLATSAYGDEHDKDITLAIRYAVNNGAKVINMSLGKDFSLHREWVFDAIKYAQKNDVLIITSAGNDSRDLTLFNEYYPNDNIDNNSEISDNFLMIGSSSYSPNMSFKKASSNYGSIDVDLFAPGDKINTIAPNDKETITNGTSAAAAITSGVAALIRSYYPDLTASQVKHILMDSGIEYTIEVATPTEDNPDKTTPFNQLSKSGKVLNAYNALIMAERVSRGM